MGRPRRASIAQSLAYGLIAAVCLIPPAAATAEQDAKALFTAQCGVCHVTDADGGKRQGPNLHNVFGRPAAALDDFKYSQGLRDAAAKGLVWNAETLDPWLADPKAMVPGSTMLYAQKDPEKRASLIEYLKTLPFEAASN